MIRVTTEITGGLGSPYYTTMHFGGTTPGEATVAANAVRAFWFELQNRLGGGLVANVEDDIPRIDPATGQIVEMFNQATTAVDLENIGDMLPWTTQALIRLRTGFFVGGRELRGRVFIPGVVEGDNTFGQPAASFVTALNTAIHNLLTASSAGGAMVVWSPTHGVADAVSSASTWDEWAVLRSRRD